VVDLARHVWDPGFNPQYQEKSLKKYWII
jgi:hypothetical protein